MNIFDSMIRLGDTEIPILRKAAEGKRCVRCGLLSDTVVGCHYTGVRRGAYGGGQGRKVHDLVMAHLCQECHKWMDQLSRDKDEKWLHSEEFLHLCMLTLIRLYEEDGILIVKGEKRG